MAAGRYHWSNAAPTARFFTLHAIACLPLLALALHPSWNGLYILLATIALLVWIEKVQKMTLQAFFRSLNIVMTGRVKSSFNLLKALGR
ncbi:MAG: hypothetical protein JWL65_7213 [Gammaproteobacteria bacterium]|nr:hypothetical protein [Gammaproteobacteria bacterium]